MMNYKKYTLFIYTILLISVSCKGQEFERVLISETDSSQLYINEEDNTELYYLKLVPKQKPIGAVVIFPSGGELVQDLIKQIDIPQLAYEKEILTIIPSINWGTDDRRTENILLDQIFREVIEKHNVPKENFILGGLSNGGMISLKYAQQSVKEKETTFLQPKGVFGLDVPLDNIHLYEYCEREIKRNFSEVGINEAKWFIKRYNKLYGGSPKEYPERYIETSIYSNGEINGGNAKYLKNIPVRMYTDLDVNWLITERRRDLYDWNGTDIVAMINDLKLMGNEDANVIITMGKGVRLDGTNHPHSWSIMDNNDCINWILKLLK